MLRQNYICSYGCFNVLNASARESRGGVGPVGPQLVQSRFCSSACRAKAGEGRLAGGRIAGADPTTAAAVSAAVQMLTTRCRGWP